MLETIQMHWNRTDRLRFAGSATLSGPASVPAIVGRQGANAACPLLTDDTHFMRTLLDFIRMDAVQLNHQTYRVGFELRYADVRDTAAQ